MPHGLAAGYVSWGEVCAIGGEKGDNGNICSLAAFEDMKVSTPKGDQGGIKHRGLPAGSQSVVHSLGELGLTREMGDLFCEKNILITWEDVGFVDIHRRALEGDAHYCSQLHAVFILLSFSHVSGFLLGGRKPFLLDAELGFGFDLFWGLFSLPSLLPPDKPK